METEHGLYPVVLSPYDATTSSFEETVFMERVTYMNLRRGHSARRGKYLPCHKTLSSHKYLLCRAGK